MNYLWQIRWLKHLNTYFKFFKRLSSLVACKETTEKTKLIRIKLLLVDMEEELIEAERAILDEQFNMTEDDVQEAQDKFQAGSVKCNFFLN